MKMKYEKIIILFVCVILLVLVLSGIYACPIKLIFGIPCPCCGITRAYLSAFHGDFESAFHYHPLWTLFFPVFALLFLNELNVIKIKAFIINLVAIIFAFLVLACYVYRLYTGTLV